MIYDLTIYNLLFYLSFNVYRLAFKEAIFSKSGAKVVKISEKEQKFKENVA